MPLPLIRVAACIVRDSRGRVLLAERTARQVGAGYWELPGGKIDAGESAADAAARELQEETGLEAIALRPRIGYEHVYRTARLQLQFFAVERWRGEPRGREGQRLVWEDPAAPAARPLLPSNERVLAALALPEVYALAPEEGCDPAAIATALHAGVKLLQLRAPDRCSDQQVGFARRMAALVHAHGARLLMAGSAHEASRTGAAGLHSSAADLHRLHGRPRVPLWIVSCHDEAQLRHATALGADAAVLSPVLPCPRHPARPPLGWDGLARLAAAATIPLYARGGLSLASLPEVRRAGAIGIATRQPLRAQASAA